MKGIILSGGRGTRLYPVTKAISKQLIPLYDKPMIYYPLTTLLQLGVLDVLVVTTPEDVESYRHLLGNGAQWGIRIRYVVQPRPNGIAEALILGRDFIDGQSVALILGDNLLHGDDLFRNMPSPGGRYSGAINFAYRVSDPQRYGIVEFDDVGSPVRLVEKPEKPRSHWAVIGLYIYDERASTYASQLVPSSRGELEITDINQRYLAEGQLRVVKLGQGNAWLDTGTHDSWLEACHYVQTILHRQGQMIGCPEEVAYRRGLIDDLGLAALAHDMRNSPYGQYLNTLLSRGPHQVRDGS